MLYITLYRLIKLVCDCAEVTSPHKEQPTNVTGPVTLPTVTGPVTQATLVGDTGGPTGPASHETSPSPVAKKRQRRNYSKKHHNDDFEYEPVNMNSNKYVIFVCCSVEIRDGD